MDPDPRVGRELAGYRIERVLGRGGMSIVYLAEHLRLHRKVALKVLSPALSEDEAFRTRFIRESEAAASLDHPNIIPIFEAGEVGNVLYIAMRYVKTTDLAVLVSEEGPLDPARVVSIIEQAASALDSAHAGGLIHRDVKPANLLIATHTGPGGADHVYLSDFGLTKRQATKSGLTRTGSFMGTLDYVPPEQIKGVNLDGRSDQYALACVLFQCLTGRVPFDRDDEATVLFAHLTEPPPSATGLRHDLPAGVDPVIARGMAKEPDDRYATCSDLAEAVRTAVQAPAGATLPIASAPTVVVSAGAATAGVAETTEAPTPSADTTEAPAPDSGKRVLPPAVPAPPERPPPDGAGRRRRILTAGLIGAALVVIVLLLVLLPLGGGEGPSEASSTGDTAFGGDSAVSPLVGKWEVTDPADGLIQLTIGEDGDTLLTIERFSDCSPPGFLSIRGTGDFRTRQERDQLFLPEHIDDCHLDAEPPQAFQEPFTLEHDPVADQVIIPGNTDAPGLDRVEEFTVNPLIGTWEVDDAQLTIQQDGTIQLVDDSSPACSPPGLIVVDEVGQFRTRRDRNQLVVPDAFADCRQGSGDVTIPELIIEHEPETDRVRTGGGPFTGIPFERV